MSIDVIPVPVAKKEITSVNVTVNKDTLETGVVAYYTLTVRTSTMRETLKAVSLLFNQSIHQLRLMFIAICLMEEVGR